MAPSEDKQGEVASFNRPPPFWAAWLSGQAKLMWTCWAWDRLGVDFKRPFYIRFRGNQQADYMTDGERLFLVEREKA